MTNSESLGSETAKKQKPSEPDLAKFPGQAWGWKRDGER